MFDKIKKYYADIGDFLKGVKAELKRVTWPSALELRKGTVAVIVILILVTTFLWLCERLLVSILGKIIPLG